MNLGEKVREQREKRGLSVSELARETAIPESIIVKIETDPAYSSTAHGRLQAKKILRYLGVEEIEETAQTHWHPPSSKISSKVPGSGRYAVLLGLLVTLAVFIYANAIYRQEKTELSATAPVYLPAETQQQENQPRVNSITLKSSGDVWITATIDGEKTIFNIRDGETKTITFQNKIAFETIGNVHQLTIQFGDQEVSFKDKEVIHNVFVDEEGVFYNGYNVLRGKPKI